MPQLESEQTEKQNRRQNKQGNDEHSNKIE